MSKLLLLSHANLSEAFYQTIELIMGKPDDRMSYITLPYGANLEEYQMEIESKVKEAKEDGILILTDLFGGSPFMISTKVYGKLQDQIPMEIITGMNLPMVVELMTNLDKPVSELKAIAKDIGSKGIIDFSEMMKNRESKGGQIMPIKMIRIDDRLIHGQIVTAWAKAIQASKIWIIDDGVAKDDFIKGVMQMVAPSDRELIISGLSEMPTLLEKLDDAPENTLILVKFPYVAKEIFKVGPKLKELNIGGIGAGPERKKLFKNISASQSEKDTLKEIQDSGIDVYFQVTPDEKRTTFSE